MAPKRSASTAPTPLRQSKRLVQQPEEPSNSSANEDSQGGDGDYQEEYSGSEFEDLDVDDEDEGLEDELLLEAIEDEVEAEEAEEMEVEDTEEEDAEEEATPTDDDSFRQVVLERQQKVLQEMNLPSDIFDRPDVDWLDTLLDVSTASSGMKEVIERFAVRLGKRDYPKSLVDVTEYRYDTDRAWWHSHCQEMDKAWEGYLERLTDILGEDIGFDISTLSKPSGPLGAVLHMQWHYPTWKTAGSEFNFCHVMDPGNSSLRQQERKIGHTTDVCTSDMIPIREDSSDPQWEIVFGTKWTTIQRLSIDFNYAIMKSSPVVVLVGKACFEAFEKELRQDNSIRLIKVLLGLSMKVFGQDAFFYVAKDRETDQVRQLIFISHHGSRFVLGSTPKEAVYADLVWNAAAATASIDILSPNHFGWFSAKTNANFAKGYEALRAQGFPGLKAGRETQQAKGYPALARGRETRRTQGFPELKRGLKSRRANGFPELKKGREIMRAQGYPNLAKGREILRAQGHPNLVKAREVIRARGPRQPVEATKALQIKVEAMRFGRSRAILRSFDVRYLLRHELSYYNDDTNAKNTYDFFAELRGWPNIWATFNPRKRAGYRQQLRKAHEYFTSLRDSMEGLRQTMTEDGKRINHTAEQRKFAIWYDKDKHPYGFRWEGDGGPAGDNVNPDVAISIFWHTETRLLKDQDAFAQVIRDALQRGHTASASLDDDNSTNGDSDVTGSDDIGSDDIGGDDTRSDDADSDDIGSEASFHTAQADQETSDQEDGIGAERPTNPSPEIPDSDSDQDDGSWAECPTSRSPEIPDSDSDPDFHY